MSSQDRDMPSKGAGQARAGDRKSTRLNSSHSQISYAVFCLKKKKNMCHGASEGDSLTHVFYIADRLHVPHYAHHESRMRHDPILAQLQILRKGILTRMRLAA